MKILQKPIFLEKNQKRQYIVELCVVFIFLCSFILQLSSCSDDGIGKNEKTEKGIPFKDGNINFEIKFETYGDDDVVATRSAADWTSETVVVPLNDDISMFATLRNTPTSEVGTRSAMLRSFNANAELHIVAYEQGGVAPVYSQNAIYSVDAAMLIPTITRISAVPITLDIGKMYRFVAFSRNNATPIPLIYPPALPLGSSPDDSDLLWGVCDSIDVTGPGTYNVTIVLKHLFSQVTVKASSSIGNITDISNVKMNGYLGSMSIDSGKLIPGAAIDQEFIGFSTTSPTLLTSDSRLVYTGDENSTIVKVGSVEIGGTTHPVPTPAIFSKKLQGGYNYNLEIKFGNVKNVTDDPPAGFIPYVGAFWKAGQTGERLIRIPRAPSGEADGTWSAVVVSGESWIELDKEWTGDSDVYGFDPDTYEKNILFDNDHKLSPAASTAITGTLRPSTAPGYEANDEFIRFRIGLKGIYVPSFAYPARYGVVLLTYNNNNLRQRIFIRQGEEPDFVMKPGDYNSFGSPAPDNRFKARKILPYNVSATTMDAVVDTIDAVVTVNPSILTNYPSQAGAMFQWAGAGAAKRFAYNPYQPTFSPWNTNIETGFWNHVSPSQETCPPGYRRPNDGPEDSFYLTGDAYDSEMRQSLFLDPVLSTGSSTSNSVYGYYADGFFDRMAISTNSTVASGTRNIAHIGRLFYNPNNFASLFFPSAGYRNSDNSNMQYLGTGSSYWTSTVADNDYAWSMNFDPTDAKFEFNRKKSTAASVRCVLEMLTATPRDVWLSPSPGNSAKVITISSTAAWEVVAPGPTNASVSPSNGLGPIDNLTITRSSTVFGLQVMTLRNLSNNELTYVAIDNYNIDDDDEFDIPNNLLTGNTGEFDIFVDGGSEKFTIVSYSSWITSASITPAGKLQIVAPQTPDLEPRTGFITIAHADDPTYTVTFPVEQDLFSTIPPFDYFVLKFTWATYNDIDIAVEFAGNDLMTNGQPVPFDNDQYYTLGVQGNYRTLGYSYTNIIGKYGGRNNSFPPSQSQLSDSLIFWGGDATLGQGETVFFNAPMITPESRKSDNSGLPRKLKLEVYTHWWNGTLNDPMRLRIMTFEGGVMSHYYDTNEPYSPDIRNYNFYNVDSYATPLIPSNLNPPIFDMDSVVIIDKAASSYRTTFRTHFTHICSIEYDRYTRGAKVTWHAAGYSGPIIVPRSSVANSISKEEFDRAAAEKEAKHAADKQKIK